MARSMIEGMLCGLGYGLEALQQLDVQVDRVLMIGGAAQNLAVQQIAATIFNAPIEVPVTSEYVAEGATVQAAWALTGVRPAWQPETMAKLQGVANETILANYKNAVTNAFPALQL